jgi:hypothetical protein
VGIAPARRKKRVVEQKQLTKGKAALLLMVSALGAIASATWLRGWQMYVGFAVVGIGIFIGFTLWNRKH